ncbi:MAG: HIRAN domain-containing protein [Planctomycetes bacterium]|nr:HIRAN domain-containing protein [Planctomycetota bacterium]MBL7144663.1 HIRAN domain-containing protein [Phycisphaerae bacterium]
MIVAELIRNGDDVNLVYLRESEDFSKAQILGFEKYPGFDTEKEVHENVLGSFMKRLPPRSRRDFGRFLDALRIKPEAKDEISDFALLGYSGAKLPDDDFTVIHPFENALFPFEFMLSVEGYQHYQNELSLNVLSTDMQADFEAEPDNPKDPEAIKVIIDGIRVGYVCRGLTTSFHKWMKSGLTIAAYVERINGTGQDPKIYLYVSVKKALCVV